MKLLMIDAAVGRIAGGSSVIIIEVRGWPSFHAAIVGNPFTLAVLTETKAACASTVVSKNAAASGSRRSVANVLDMGVGVG